MDIHEIGLDAFIAKVEQEFFQNCMDKFNGNKGKCRLYMKVGSPRFQRILKAGVQYVQ